jgi:putative serine/threonine protein kinase
LRNPTVVFTENLVEKPYSSILCYPKLIESEMKSRVEELERLGVKAVEFAGKASVFNVPVVGKGYVGVVVIAHLDGKKVALKIRRLDADRVGLQHEAEMLSRANSVNVGPALVRSSKNFLLTQFIEGDLLPRWLETSNEKPMVHGVLADVLEQCYRLDLIGLDHGELSKAPKHVIVDVSLTPWIVDFETASSTRRSANVTAICQYLFLGKGFVTELVAESLGWRSTDNIVDVLRIYKNSKTRESFDQVLQTCLH